MKEDEIIVQVQKINSEFCRAFESISIERMEGLRKHEDSVFAYSQVWTYLLVGCCGTNTKVRVFDNITVVVCLENVETLVNREIVRLGGCVVVLLLTYLNKWKINGYLSIIMVHLYQITYHQIFLNN